MAKGGKIKAYQQLEHSDCGLVCIRKLTGKEHKVTESGTHRELMELDGEYASLIRRQLMPDCLPA